MPRTLKLLAVIMLAAVPVTLAQAPDIAHATCGLVPVYDSSGFLIQVRQCTDEIPVVHPSELTSVRRSVCSSWQMEPYLNPDISPPAGVVVGPDLFMTRVAADGVTETLYFRFCGDQIEHGWLRPFTPVDLANTSLRDLKQAGLPAPTASFAPPLDKMIVNFETWFAVEPVSAPPVRSQVGNVWSEATATPVSIVFTTGSISRNDTATVTCRPWGSTKGAADGCTWSPKFPSVPKVTGTDDLHYHGSIAIVWDVTWTSSTGAGGSLGQLSTVTPINIGVMEIQIIGG